MQERDISRQLALREQGACEVRTPAGFIDVLTATSLYEVKDVAGWKGAVGQLLAYARYYPEHTPKLYLYGKVSGKQKTLIADHCKALNIKVVWHRDDSETPAQKPREEAKAVLPDIFSLHLLVIDFSLHLLVIDRAENIKANSTMRLMMPYTQPRLEVLNAYADEVLAVFDALLDNELAVTLTYRQHGQTTTVQRSRPNVPGRSAYNRLTLSIQTPKLVRFTVSIPGVRAALPSGKDWRRSRAEQAR